MELRVKRKTTYENILFGMSPEISGAAANVPIEQVYIADNSRVKVLQKFPVVTCASILTNSSYKLHSQNDLPADIKTLSTVINTYKLHSQNDLLADFKRSAYFQEAKYLRMLYAMTTKIKKTRLHRSLST